MAATYTLSQTRSIIDEGSIVTIYLDTSDVPDGAAVPYEISAIYGSNINAADFTVPLTGNFIINSNRGRIDIQAREDTYLEGSETFQVRLTGPGRTEFVTVGINDTSVGAPQARFYITSSATLVSEGQYVDFFVRAEGVDAGTQVPYNVLGIQPEDLVTDVTTGTLLFTARSGFPGQTEASLRLALLEDFETEGTETIVLLLNPSFPYVLEVTSTVLVVDSSEETDPIFTINTDKTVVIEGDSFTISVVAQNVPANTIVNYELVPLANTPGGLEIQDFEGLDSFKGQFPPLNSFLETSKTFVTRDDKIFEQTEYFYFAIPGYFPPRSTPVIQLIDSGNTLVTANATYTGNIELRFLDKAVLTPNVAGLYQSRPSWIDSTGKLSESMYLQGRTAYASEDAAPFYQPFSYVIRSKRSIEEWRENIKTMLHPAGLALFSEINNETELDEILDVGIRAGNSLLVLQGYGIGEDSEVKSFFSITSDTNKIRASNTTFTSSKLDINLTADGGYYIFSIYE
jgi:hypothetical protein